MVMDRPQNAWQVSDMTSDVPDFPWAADNAKYMEDYANHYDITRRCHMGASVHHLERTGDRWTIKYSQESQGGIPSQEVMHFDKVIVTSGAFSKSFTPTYDGMENFKGRILHVQGFKESDIQGS